MARIVSSEDFNNEIKDGVVIVDFYADWCGPCKMLGPIFEELDSEIGDKVKFIKIDVDQSRDIAGRFKVMTIPTMIVFNKGNKVETEVGFKSKEYIKELLEKYI